MILKTNPPSLYAAFDRFPYPKGAAIHIGHTASTLFAHQQGGCLYVLGGENLPTYQREGNIEILRFQQSIPNFLERAMAYSTQLATLLTHHAHSLRLCHFRDPWSGLPILSHQDASYKTVYEVNGLPSIELPYAYPHLIGTQTLAKIKNIEKFCLTNADIIVTPATTIKNNLVQQQKIPAEKISVIPNGADITPLPPKPITAPAQYLIYFGAVQQWQGLDVLIKAFRLLADFEALHLVLCLTRHGRQVKPYHKLVTKLDLTEKIMWFYGLNQEELAAWRGHALLSVAPLIDCTRNLDQGCCPLKILESMASGVPVVASNLPVVKELITNGVHGRLVRPNRPADLARAIRILLEYPAQRQQMGQNAQQLIKKSYTWNHNKTKLIEIYNYLIENTNGK